MAEYRFSAEDSSGSHRTGNVEASSAIEALKLLRVRGFTGAKILEGHGEASASAPPTKPPNQPSPPDSNPVRTRLGTDKERFFLLAQLSKQIDAGINPGQALKNIAQTARAPYIEALLEVARRVEGGAMLGDSLAHYPDLFPHHVVGLVRAGEVGGFLPQALDYASNQAESAHSFRRFCWFIGPIVIHALIMIPMAWLLCLTMLRYWDILSDSGGESGTLLDAVAWGFRWPVGPAALTASVSTFLLYRLFMSRPLQNIRHRLGLIWPVLGKRARHESIRAFSWTLSRISTAGISPQRAWELAVNAVPNLEMRARLVKAGNMMRENSKFSEAAAQSGIFQEEYVPILSTGELVGDIPGTLDRLAQVEAGEFQVATTRAKLRVGCWGLLALFVTAGIVLIMVTWMWYRTLPAKALGELNF